MPIPWSPLLYAASLVHLKFKNFNIPPPPKKKMWREFLMKMRSRDSSQRSENCSSDSDSEGTCDSDYSGLSGHYSFRNQEKDNNSAEFKRTQTKRFNGSRFLQSHVETESTSNSAVIMSSVVDEESCNTWREKFEFTLSLIREPRYLLAETLVAEQLKLTLKQQAYRLEQILVRQTIDEHQKKSTESPSEAAGAATITASTTTTNNHG